MKRRLGFDNGQYLKEQTAAIHERVQRFRQQTVPGVRRKTAVRSLCRTGAPGFDPNVKIGLLRELRNEADVLLCIHAGDIERRKLRADFGITYDVDALKLIDDLRTWDVEVLAVVITRFDNQPAATIFKNKLERRGIRLYTHKFTRGYTTDVDTIVSDRGYGANEYIETEKPLVIVTGPAGYAGSCGVSRGNNGNAVGPVIGNCAGVASMRFWPRKPPGTLHRPWRSVSSACALPFRCVLRRDRALPVSGWSFA